MKNPNETDKNPRPNHWLRAIEFRKHQLTREYRGTLGDKAREGVSDEDYATTMATLEKMARNLGWDESQRPDLDRRAFGRGLGHGHRHPGMMRGFGPRGFHGPFDHNEADETKPEA
jgi:hypothetical protein